MSQELIQVKKFKPHKDLFELADMIRNLSSEQIAGMFTYGKFFNKRCILGALAVEYFGSIDSNENIVDVIADTWIHNFETKYKVKMDDPRGGINTYQIDLKAKLVSMNDHGRTFNEIADWVELEAYRHGL